MEYCNIYGREETERNHAENALRESEAKFRSIIEASPLGVHIWEFTPDGRFIFTGFNPAADAILGIDHSQLLGMTIPEAFPALAHSDVPRIYNDIAEHGGTWHDEQYEYQDDRIAGAFEIHAFQVSPGRMIAMFSDVKERILTETALQQKSQELAEANQALETYHAFVQNAASILLRLDLKGNILFMNDYGLQFFGWSEEELFRKNVLGTILPEQESTGRDLAAFLEDFLRSPEKYVSNVNENIRKNGERVWVAWTNRAILNEAGEPLEIVVTGTDITDLRRIEESLRASEARFRTLFETMTEGFTLDEILFDDEGQPCDLQYLEANPAFEHHTGIKANDVLGHTTLELFPDAEPIWFERYGKVASTGVPDHFQAQFGPLNRWFEVSAYRTEPNQVAMVFFDITERKRAEEDLQKQAEALAASNQELTIKGELLDSASDSIFLLDLDLTIAYANDVACESHGYSIDELVGQNFINLIHQDILPLRNTRNQEILEKGELTYESMHLRKDGSSFPVEAKTRVFETGGKKYFLSTFHDLTSRKREEEHLRELNTDLERSNRDLEAFAYAASHDLQAPLRTIIGFLTLLQRRYGTLLPEKGNELVDRSVGAADRLQHLVLDLLAFSRAASRELDVKESNLNDLVSEIVADMHADLEASQGKIDFEQLPALAVDRTQLRQVFHNLLANAIKFRREGVPPEVSVSVESTPGEWIFAVKDNGIGFDPALMSKLFKPFKRLHTDDEYPGTGIGLAIAKRVVERHGGRIWAESEPGMGSTFFFSLPRTS
jgi:PAS domain S-box-containing protein